jgi:hypothetical protein
MSLTHVQRPFAEDVTYGYTSDTQIETYYFAAAVTKGDAVIHDVATTSDGQGQTITLGTRAAKQSTATANLPILGFAKETVAAGNYGEVVVKGPCYMKVNADVNAALALITSSDGTAGQCKIATAGTHHVVGYVLEASGAVTAGYARGYKT